MILPMKKVSLIILGHEKSEMLKRLRKLGLLHIEISEGSGDRLSELHEQISLLESSIFIIGEQAKKNAFFHTRKKHTITDINFFMSNQVSLFLLPKSVTGSFPGVNLYV